jgi:hypothetical protein
VTSADPELRDPDGAPDTFRRALESLRGVRLRPEVVLAESAAPQRLAPFAVALTADVVVGADEEIGTGRFVLLHDPAGHETWQGTFRVVTFVRAELERDLADDPLVPSVGWSWLEEALDDHGAAHTAASGTVTRVVSEPFGTMAERGPSAELEIRASWTAPDSRLGPHLQAWGDLLATVCGLPPLASGIVPLPRHGSRRSR